MKLQGETSLSSAFLEDILSLLFQGVKKKVAIESFPVLRSLAADWIQCCFRQRTRLCISVPFRNCH